jgi:phosphatidylinositol N-acetylglucosaminyltransferase subunit Q
LWLVVNDVLLGLLLGHLLRTHAPALGRALAAAVQHVALDHVEAMVTWLMGWPSGIKLNSNLDEFYGNVCLAALGLWRGRCCPAPRFG